MSEIIQKKILVLGAGYGGAYTFKYLHKRFHKNKRVSLKLVNRNNYFISTPLLHEVATGSISPEHIVEPLRKILACTHEEFVMASVGSVSLASKTVTTTAGELEYDYLVMALGAETNYRGVPGAQEHTLTLKSLEDAISLKNHFIEVFERASRMEPGPEQDKTLCFVLVGAGATGVELAAEMRDLFWRTFVKYYKPELLARARIIIIHAGDDLLPNFERDLRVKSKYILRKKGIDLRFGIQVVEVRDKAILLNTGELLESETIIWTAGVKPSSIGFDVDLPKDRQGRIIVNQYFQIADFPEVFVLGDQAAFKNPDGGDYLPMLAQVAHKESEGVARNVIRQIEGKPLLRYTYKHMGDLISLGDWMAAGEIFGVRLFGHLTWFLWRGIYLAKLLSPSKKAKVLLDWIVNLFSPRDISELYKCEPKD